MKHDPFTKEGREEILKILERRRMLDRHLIERAYENVEDEPTGPLTCPSELDLMRDRKRNVDD